MKLNDPPYLGSDWFWGLIDQAATSPERLRMLLLPLSRKELYAFQDEFVELASQIRGEPYDAFMEPSEDGIEDITDWAVSQGRTYYLGVLDDPSTLPFSVDGRGLEILSGVAPRLYRELFGEGLDVY
jgi:hypothetical protein